MVSRPDSCPLWTVVVWDFELVHFQLVNKVISVCGARALRLETLSAVREIMLTDESSVALVFFERRDSAGDQALEVVGVLKQKGFKIIGFGEDTGTWPLGMRCQLLLAGVSCLLDTADRKFAEKLGRWLAHLLPAEAVRRAEETILTNGMEKLGIVGKTQAMVSIFARIHRVSSLSDLATLIIGETGTGKELLAHAIHRLDPKRCSGPFVGVNCAAISPALAESELFGHRRGAFTGAHQDRKGLIRSAERGVLFLDEISELDLSLQAKFLRVLQENRVLGVGEEREVSVDVRVIAASNRDLEQMVQLGKFRADLFHRLNVLSICIPPLRERPEDIVPLVEHFLRKCGPLARGVSLAVSPEFLEALAQVELPGNARQLENLIRWAVVNKDADIPLSLSDLPPELWRQFSGHIKSPSVQQQEVGRDERLRKPMMHLPRQDFPSYLLDFFDINAWNLSQTLQHCEKLLLEAALHLAHGNQSKTGRLLGITPRSVYNKVRRHGLRF